MKNLSKICRTYLGGGLLLACLSGAYAQNPYTMPHTVHVLMVTPPTGPNSDFSMTLTVSPNDVDIAGFSIVIGYNNNLASFISAQDNTGQATAWQYDRGSDYVLTGVPYANIYMPLVVSTMPDLIEPVNLARLNFRTSASYNPAVNNFYVYLDDWPPDPGLMGGYSQGLPVIPTEYDSLEPTPTAVSDWELY